MIDRSLLSDARVIKAAQKYICIRPLSYEDKEESDYLRKVLGRSALPNTVFALLDPTATAYITRPSRTPIEAFIGSESDAGPMAAGLDQYANTYAAKSAPTTLPTIANIKLALNVSACDNRPLAVLLDAPAVAEKLKAIAWSSRYVGQFSYVVVTDVASLKNVPGASNLPGVTFVQSGEYGLDGKAIGFSGAECTVQELTTAMDAALANFKPNDQSDHQGHLARAVRAGIRWKSTIPCEDAQGNNATNRLWSRGGG